MLAKNTRIMMADGSMKYIQDIGIGERLLTQNNGQCIVQDIITGWEDIMLELFVDDKTIMMSRDQMIMTTSGLKRAVDIMAGDKFILAGGKAMEMKCIMSVEYVDTVHMLILDNRNLFFAEDIVMGD